MRNTGQRRVLPIRPDRPASGPVQALAEALLALARCRLEQRRRDEARSRVLRQDNPDVLKG
jgi:hypothetical protein